MNLLQLSWKGSSSALLYPRNTSYDIWCVAEYNDFQNDEGGQER